MFDRDKLTPKCICIGTYALSENCEDHDSWYITLHSEQKLGIPFRIRSGH